MYTIRVRVNRELSAEALFKKKKKTLRIMVSLKRRVYILQGRPTRNRLQSPWTAIFFYRGDRFQMNQSDLIIYWLILHKIRFAKTFYLVYCQYLPMIVVCIFSMENVFISYIFFSVCRYSVIFCISFIIFIFPYRPPLKQHNYWIRAVKIMFA